MNRITILNRIHKDLVIPISKHVHSLKYQKVIEEINRFIDLYWGDNQMFYSHEGVSMYSSRFSKYHDMMLDSLSLYGTYENIFKWKFNVKKRKTHLRSTYIRLPERYQYTTTKWEIKDVKLIK